jgi:kinesin family protein 1
MVKDNADGTSNVTIVGQWDSSLHNSLLLDRTTADKYRVQISLRWNLISSCLQDPITFELDQTLQVLGRTYVRPQPMFRQFWNPTFWNPTRVVHSTVGIFSVAIRPVSAKRAADLWRMNTQNDYVKGEELLMSWSPRKVSLVRDFIAARKRRQRSTELEAARGALSADSLVASPARGSGRSTPLRGQEMSERQTKLLHKYLSLWSTRKDPSEVILVNSNTEQPAFSKEPLSPDSASLASDYTPSRPRYVAAVQNIPKNPSILKSGYLLTPDDTNSHWVRRYIELRRPYLHVHSVPDGDEINAINLRHSRVDHDPDFARLLDGSQAGADDSISTKGRPNIFTVYGTQNTFLFAARTEAQKVEWILKIDQGYFSGNAGNGDRERR